ncbi:MAG TPA: hypothetical protein DFR83_09840 [Deltaproteobacteria bacterium]|nr:hypothetical protein [Deltaproteobacteria bacterium]
MVTAARAHGGDFGGDGAQVSRRGVVAVFGIPALGGRFKPTPSREPTILTANFFTSKSADTMPIELRLHYPAHSAANGSARRRWSNAAQGWDTAERGREDAIVNNLH